VDNVRVPAFSELEILAKVVGGIPVLGGCYMMEGVLRNSDLMVARTLVSFNEVVPVQLLNPTETSIVLYFGAKELFVRCSVECHHK